MQLLSLNDWHQNLPSSDRKKGVWEVGYTMYWMRTEIDIMGKERVKKGHDND